MAVVPASLAVLLYLPFRLTASRINTTTWGDSDNFYHMLAIATWPAFSALLAFTICFLAVRYKVRMGWHPVLIFVAIAAVLNTGMLDQWFAWNDTGRSGLDMYPSNFDTISTPEISHNLVLPVFLVCWCATIVITTSIRIRRRAEQ
ncbi:hypothetical protein [Rhodopirellula islandica]|uniref:hypothetical protein n=1 Tax=Rhodopirellula islandica TaxID=595434 RepID=UPI0012374CB1|nr:hypothetical protein [Rhodopirellula islandica]